MKNCCRSSPTLLADEGIIERIMNNKSIVIGITGNMGSGKSTFAGLIRDAGYSVISADRIAQDQLTRPDNLKSIVHRWGSKVVKDGKPDKARIADIVFAEKSELEYLNNLVHPGTLVDMQKLVDQSADKYLFFEVPLLFEAGMQGCFDFIILIHVEAETSIKRLIKSGKVTREQLQARLSAQIESTSKFPLCDMIIDNNGTLNALKQKAKDFLARLNTIKPRPKIPFSD